MRGHEHVVETVCFGKKPLDAAAIVAAAATNGTGSSSTSSSNANGEVKDTQVCAIPSFRILSEKSGNFRVSSVISLRVVVIDW